MHTGDKHKIPEWSLQDGREGAGGGSPGTLVSPGMLHLAIPEADPQTLKSSLGKGYYYSLYFSMGLKTLMILRRNGNSSHYKIKMFLMCQFILLSQKHPKLKSALSDF